MKGLTAAGNGGHPEEGQPAHATAGALGQMPRAIAYEKSSSTEMVRAFHRRFLFHIIF